MFNALLDADAALFLWVDQLPHPAWITAAMFAVTLAGTAGCIWIVVAAGIALRQRDGGGLWRTLLSLLFVFMLVDLGVKPIIERPRPYERHTTAVDASSLHRQTSSFPSGHAASAAAGTYAITRLAPTAARILWPVAVTVTISRIYLGMHYPLDVVVGWLIGLAGGVFVTGGLTYGSCPRTR